MISYNNIVARFETFVENHKFLRQFSHGSPEDLDQGKEPEYPLLHLVLTGVNYPDRTTDSLGTSKTYSLNIFILSLPPDKIDKTSHQKEVISDSIQIAEDVIADVINGFNVFTESGQYYTTGVSIEPLEEETKNVLAGVLLTLDLTVPYEFNACDLPLTGVDEPGVVECEDATYQNSDGSFSTTIASGGTFTANDITVTDVDNTTRDVPANTDVSCEWKTITVRNTEDVEKQTVSTYPSGGNIELDDVKVTDLNGYDNDFPLPSQIGISGRPITSVAYSSVVDLLAITVEGCPVIFPIDIVNSLGGTLDTISADPSGSFEIGTVDVIDADGTEAVQRPSTNIQIEDSNGLVSATVIESASKLKIRVPDAATPSGIKYRDVRPLLVGLNSYAVGDAMSNYYNGLYDRTHPTYPDRIATINPNAIQSDIRGTAAPGSNLSDSIAPTMLLENNHFGNKYAWTDDQGNPSDASVTSLYSHVDWRNHSWTGATPNYVINHETGWGYYLVYLTDGTKYNLDSNTTNGQSWEDWIAYVASLGTFQGMSGWMIVDLGDMETFIGAQALDFSPNNAWALNFLTFESGTGGSTRGALVTSESQNANEYWQITDNGQDVRQILPIPKLNDGQFLNRLANIFIKRKHF